MKLAFIVVLYKTPKKEVSRLKSEISRLGFENYELYLLDNTLINRGYAKAVNLGIKKALLNNVDLIVISNPDISLKNLGAKKILEAAKKFDIWGLAMKQHGKTYYGGFIDPLRLSGWLRVIKPQKRFLKTTWVSGSLMFIKKEVVDNIGLFDERFFMYYEDVDYCVRAVTAGFRIGIDSFLQYEHYEWISSNLKRKELLSSARKIFFKKHGNLWQKTYEFLRLPKTIWEKLQK